MVRFVRRLFYPACIAVLTPLNRLLAWWHAGRYVRGSVLHISYPGHIPFQTVEILRANGVNAAYLSVGDSLTWSAADFQITRSPVPLVSVLREFLMLWRVVARFEIVHLHFIVTMTRSGWELPLLKRMGRKVVVHYRGCEIRDREQNIARHPEMNICEECDYRPPACQEPYNVLRRALARRYGDAYVVTTPDLKDFAPNAIHLPFFAPVSLQVSAAPSVAGGRTRPFKIVHATNHPGIEGTRHIAQAIERLKAKGFRIDFTLLKGVAHERVLAELADADLAIGKMKMGHYANAQIESMAAGVPTVTYVRQEWITPELNESGFIFASLESLESVLERYLSDPVALAEKRARARESILRLHDNVRIARQYASLYDAVRKPV